MPLEGIDTAKLLFFFNELFDSLNGSIKLENNKQEQLWIDAIAVIKTMQFIQKRSHDRKTPAVLKNGYTHYKVFDY